MKKYNEERQEAREVSGEGDGVVKSQSPTAWLCLNTPSDLIAGELHSSDHVCPGSPYEQEQ